MGTDRHYRPGSFYRIDARTGFATRAERTSKEWTGQIVRERSWEPRQPQDFVRGSVDTQIVPEPRPRMPEMFMASGITTLTGQAGDFAGIGDFAIGNSAIGTDNLIAVASVFGWLSGDVVWIMQDNGDYWRAEITSDLPDNAIGRFAIGLSTIGTPFQGLAIDGLTVTISPPMIRRASAGNQVVNISAQRRLVGAAAYPGEVGGFGIGVDEIGVTSLDEFGQAPEGYQNEEIVPYGSR